MRWVVLVAAAVFFAGIVGAIVAAYQHPAPQVVPTTSTVAK